MLSDNIKENDIDPLSFVTSVANTFNFNPITTEERDNHGTLLSKLKLYGIKGNPWKTLTGLLHTLEIDNKLAHAVNGTYAKRNKVWGSTRK